MRIIVCAKIIKGEINPFDACALECALRLSDDVTVISMSPKSAMGELSRLTRLGARVICLSDTVFAGSDTLSTAYILSCAIKKLRYDLIICGRQSIDGDTAQVGPCLSAMLSIGLITNVMSIDSADSNIRCTTRSGAESVTYPALVTVERIAALRFPSLRSKESDVCVLTNRQVCADVSRCGFDGSPTRVIQTFENQRGRRKCRFIGIDELQPLVETLVKEPVAAVTEIQSPVKLKNVWAIGRAVSDKASAIAESVTFIDETDPHEIARLAKERKPSVILWNADLWGRKNAPIVAALLNTGLCADCTALETDGERLLMYRPAVGGNIIAKIECRTLPQMATVRTETVGSDVMVCGGNGIARSLVAFNGLVSKLHGEKCASRGLVDMGLAPYCEQIGLTGRNVSPKVYIAVGVSGAVQHTCAIEGAGTVIAVNPDKNARIFEYSDYGVVGEV